MEESDRVTTVVDWSGTHQCTHTPAHKHSSSSSKRCNRIYGILYQWILPWDSLQRKSLCNMVSKCSWENPWMFYKPANEHFSHTAVNIVWSVFFLQWLLLLCMAWQWCLHQPVIKEEPAAVEDPPEPVTLLVSMALLQAAPQAGCVQGPIQPVFSATAPLMFSPGAGVKLPSANRKHCTLSLSRLAAASQANAQQKQKLIWIRQYSQLLLGNCYMCRAVKVLWPPLRGTVCALGQSNKITSHSWLTSVRALVHVLLLCLYHLRGRSRRSVAGLQVPTGPN